ncbi:MAG: polysaccharide lyase family 7 protein [Pseudomonas sp.]
MIDLATWNLSIPEGSPPTTIDTPKLVAGYKGKYFNAETGTLFFWAPVTGSRTINAIYPRSELRETYSNGELHNWLYPSSDNFLRATVAVNQVPSSGRIVIGQIHAYESTEPLLKVEYQFKDSTQSGNIVAKVRNRFDDKDPRVITIAEDLPLNEPFKYIIHLSSGGQLSISVRDMNWSSPISATWRDKPLYFKAGVYTQDNTGYTSEGGKATFYKLDIDHNKG